MFGYMEQKPLDAEKQEEPAMEEVRGSQNRNEGQKEKLDLRRNCELKLDNQEQRCARLHSKYFFFSAFFCI